MRFPKALFCMLASACATTTTAPGTLPVDQVVLYQNGVGYFERRGVHEGGELRLRFARDEVDDVLETLTVLSAEGEGITSVRVPRGCDDAECVLGVDAPASDGLAVAYAVPVPRWNAAYRVVLDEQGARLQVWAMVHNASEEPWDEVTLRLATAAPFSFASGLTQARRGRSIDASHRFRPEPTLGVVTGERGRSRDGGPDDLCPDEPEDYDGFEDLDGCPDPDHDRDGILDVEDECPDDPELYNGISDDDGCPDRGMVRVQSSSIRIVDHIYFERAEGSPGDRSRAILDAVAATLQGNSEIRVRVEGHAARDETNAWSLSAERAASVREALVERGVDPNRMEVVPFGATRPVASGSERNRRVDFHIVEARAEESNAVPAPLTLATSIEAASGAVVYAPSSRVSIDAGASALVAVLDRRLEGAETLLFRPDASVPGSNVFPFRAARFRAPADLRLVPGPVAVFSQGRFVGEGVLDGLQPEETALIPYVLDRSARVQVEHENHDEPRRIIALERGEVTVESMAVLTTRYRIEPGATPAQTIVLRHPSAAGRRLRSEPPPGAEQSTGAVLVPLPLRPSTTSELVVEEELPMRRRVNLLGDLATSIDLYLRGTELPPETRRALRQALALRVTIRESDDQARELRSRMGDLAARSAELRRNLEALRTGGAEPLRRTLRTRLRDATQRTEALSRTIEEATARRSAARAELGEILGTLRIRLEE